MAKFEAFVGPSYESQSVTLAGERTINWIPEAIETASGKTRQALYPVPGLPTWSTPGTGAGRAFFGEDGRLFGLFGAELFELASNGTATARGTVAFNSDPGTIHTNGEAGDELLVVSGGRTYIFDLGTLTLTAVMTGVTDVVMGDYVDSFFLALTGAGLRISEAYDGLTWDAGQLAARSKASDPWRAMKVVNQDIYLIGEKTGEVWYNAGLSTFPFSYRPGSFFHTGIEAPWSLHAFGASLAWLGRSENGSGRVFWLNGYTPNRISNHAVEWAIASYQETSTISNAIAWSYEALGHEFYVLQFPSVDATWIYDSTTRQWHERARWDGTLGEWRMYRPRFHMDIFDRRLVTDGEAGRIYRLSYDHHTDIDGTELRRLRKSPHLASENRLQTYDSFEVEVERGVGTVEGQGVDPQLMMRLSRDGGKTWTPERWAGLGKMGEYGQRVRWPQCGRGRDVVFEVSGTDPVPMRLGGAYLEVR